jgi:hypothetical protein
MRKSKAFKPLAVSLATLRWTEDDIATHLRQRLPRGWERTPLHLARALIETFPAAAAPDAGRIAEALATLGSAQRIWRHAARIGQPPDFPLDPPPFRPIPPLEDLGLPEITTQDALAEWLAISPDHLRRFADLRALSALNPSHFAQHYRHHLIAKATGALRLIEEPKPVLKTIQRRILTGLLDPVPPHDSAYGFRKGRSCITAAARHAGEAMVVRFDLKDFFPAIGVTRIYALFRTLGYPAPVARNLTGLCTSVTPPEVQRTPGLSARQSLSTRHLPQGAPTSPALANLVAYRLDCRLTGLARALGANYTRYAESGPWSPSRARRR